jgi:hypothetical protein
VIKVIEERFGGEIEYLSGNKSFLNFERVTLRISSFSIGH